jgi:hypothetical protein
LIQAILKFLFLLLQSSYIALVLLIDPCTNYVQDDIIIAVAVVVVVVVVIIIIKVQVTQLHYRLGQALRVPGS